MNNDLLSCWPWTTMFNCGNNQRWNMCFSRGNSIWYDFQCWDCTSQLQWTVKTLRLQRSISCTKQSTGHPSLSPLHQINYRLPLETPAQTWLSVLSLCFSSLWLWIMMKWSFLFFGFMPLLKLIPLDRRLRLLDHLNWAAQPPREYRRTPGWDWTHSLRTLETNSATDDGDIVQSHLHWLW